MIATIEKGNNVVTATYTRNLNHATPEVWSFLTENKKLKQWFSELEIQSLEKRGKIFFDLQDGNYEEMEILDVVENEVFAFTWPPTDSVRFELKSTGSGCELVFKEFIHNVTEHTPKDLAGWHICLDVIERLLNGKSTRNRKAEWEACYPKYQELVASIN
ncbi:SRPBCC family protein [Oceanobacillus bengalensis]|uniref:SRPBCC family protein n=1 Tax=Oceanobacillus bengalensis TaxID=1435466 RepID=A0A494YSA1_9BACI|nr:SRPBCC family protein [Oceanobacillus bengalensis]RKQ12815.1 SRPBCC family protein [Oceanobacillus bengalensis]